MTTPITDLGTSTVNYGSGGFVCPTGNMILQTIRHRYKQKPPFNLILPYSFYEGYAHGYSQGGASPRGYEFGPASNPFDTSSFITTAKNASYEKLRGGIYDQAALGVDFAEARQSIGMIASTAGALFKAAFAVRKLHFGEAANVLRMKFLPKGVSKSKSFASNWLEFHFGWEPLVHDIYDASNVLTNPVMALTYKKGHSRIPINVTRHNDYGSVYSDWFGNGYAFALQGARLKRVNDPTILTLNQLGVANPASIAWELVPFSFVVDWFVNIGDCLGSLSDFAGLTLDSTFCTTGYKLNTSGYCTVKPQYGTGYAKWSVDYVKVDRSTTLSGVTFQVKQLKPPSVVRAATAISLLVQQLRR